ncbi:MAG: mechanosensitive ion channel family protein [Candidatus Saganbacteria bacterium]|nr:mechanosensitive ion channel family protein [Candidatus Saganbacteria bacterium]
MDKDVLAKYLQSINHEMVITYAVTTIIIFILAIVLMRVILSIINRWQKKALSSLSEKSEAAHSLDTRVTIVKRLVSAGIYFFAFIIFLLQFDALRSLGAGLLASAGVAGVVFGMAAQNTLADVVAGISISFSQPIKLDDAVIFEDDFGWIEEISLMHTVIRTWDNRRLVVPNSVLVHKTIQNWTMKDPSLLGIVMLYVDYYCDVDKVRGWVNEIVKASPSWNKKGDPCVQIVDFTEKSMQLRILATAADAPTAWNLRCEIREGLINRFKAAKLPLPVIRVQGEKLPV